MESRSELDPEERERISQEVRAKFAERAAEFPIDPQTYGSIVDIAHDHAPTLKQLFDIYIRPKSPLSYASDSLNPSYASDILNEQERERNNRRLFNRGLTHLYRQNTQELPPEENERVMNGLFELFQIPEDERNIETS